MVEAPITFLAFKNSPSSLACSNDLLKSPVQYDPNLCFPESVFVWLGVYRGATA